MLGCFAEIRVPSHTLNVFIGSRWEIECLGIHGDSAHSVLKVSNKRSWKTLPAHPFPPLHGDSPAHLGHVHVPFGFAVLMASEGSPVLSVARTQGQVLWEPGWSQ